MFSMKKCSQLGCLRSQGSNGGQVAEAAALAAAAMGPSAGAEVVVVAVCQERRWRWGQRR